MCATSRFPDGRWTGGRTRRPARCGRLEAHLRYRPPGQPHFGGITERLIGTLMRDAHELPGTTFSSTVERGAYDTDAMAALTLRDPQQVEIAHWDWHHSFLNLTVDGE
ncbi:hypothetical protein CGL27_47570 [Streptomyces sp. 11-1-2]|nr:hypothetical protein CGL27_47570 [Streptomyces sp. 11-1-2]